jgi:uncharacterized protein YgiM (DUF1202 family)
MINKKYKIALITLPVLIGGYFIYRLLKGKKTYEEAVMEADGGSTDGSTDDGGSTGDGGSNDGGGDSGSGTYAKYKVTTLVSNLNIRQNPSTNSTILTSVPKGTIIDAKASSTSGWMEVMVGSTNGFASAQYLTKI